MDSNNHFILNKWIYFVLIIDEIISTQRKKLKRNRNIYYIFRNSLYHYSYKLDNEKNHLKIHIVIKFSNLKETKIPLPILSTI
jgi:uncharacterized protein with von Willebrand factor type A (vWA) domain